METFQKEAKKNLSMQKKKCGPHNPYCLQIGENVSFIEGHTK